MRGTWQTTDSGGGKVVLLILGALLLLGDGGAVAAVGAGLFDALIGVVAAVFLLVIAGIGVLVHHARNPSQEGFVRLPGVRAPTRYDLPDPQRAAIGEAAPRELHQHVHLHMAPGADPAEAAEIIRRAQRPER